MNCSKHPDRPVQAKGLCASCYNGQNLKAAPGRYERKLERNRQWLSDNKEHVSNYRRQNAARIRTLARYNRARRQYGLTVEQYKALVARANGKCELCSLETSELHIDHCHKTGRVRGLLCGNCNTGLGLFKERIDVLMKTIPYLEVVK